MHEYQTESHALRYMRERADAIPHRTEGEAALLEILPADARQVLDLGTGGGRLTEIVLLHCPQAQVVATDFSEPMLEAARARFCQEPRVRVQAHDFNRSIVPLGTFDAVLSSFAIHHVENPRKQSLYGEVYNVLSPGGVFANLEHVSSPTETLHDAFLAALGMTRETEDQSNRCTPVEPQLAWLRDAGFKDVDCYWKWRELALLVGVKP